MTLLLATTSADKVREIRSILAGVDVTLVTLAEVGPVAEPEESGATFWENARIKALAYAAATGLTAVAEDSGLVIDALGGAPGVYSARFLSPAATYPERFAEIFRRLAGQAPPFEARFVTALAVARGDRVIFETETRVDGVLAEAPAGTQGFGYDPIFRYPPFGTTTAEMTLTHKSAVSHRARAFRDLKRALPIIN